MTTTITRQRATILSPSLPPSPVVEPATRPSLASRILHIFLPVSGDHIQHIREAERANSLRVLTIR